MYDQITTVELSPTEAIALSNLVFCHYEYGNGRDNEDNLRRLEDKIVPGPVTFTYEDMARLYWAYRDSLWMVKNEFEAWLLDELNERYNFFMARSASGG